MTHIILLAIVALLLSFGYLILIELKKSNELRKELIEQKAKQVQAYAPNDKYEYFKELVEEHYNRPLTIDEVKELDKKFYHQDEVNDISKNKQ